MRPIDGAYVHAATHVEKHVGRVLGRIELHQHRVVGEHQVAQARHVAQDAHVDGGEAVVTEREAPHAGELRTVQQHLGDVAELVMHVVEYQRVVVGRADGAQRVRHRLQLQLAVARQVDAAQRGERHQGVPVDGREATVAHREARHVGAAQRLEGGVGERAQVAPAAAEHERAQRGEAGEAGAEHLARQPGDGEVAQRGERAERLVRVVGVGRAPTRHERQPRE